MTRMRTIIAALAIVVPTGLLLSACSPQLRGSAPAVDVVAGHRVTIMTFNVENLFDNVDAPGKNDETYLAIEDKQDPAHIAVCEAIDVDYWREQCLYWDWSDRVLERKLAAVAAAILQVDGGRGADIVALQEVENYAILDRLRTEYLDDAGYGPPILLEGHDIRGIDVAFLSRLELAGEPALHRPEFPGVEQRRIDDTRGVLEATFVLPDGSLLTGYSVHFPAPFHPTAMREMAYDHLNEIRSRLPADRLVFAAGDFNTPAREVDGTDIFDRRVRPYWVVAHEAGCDDCPGTNYWATGDSWSFLDMILWSSPDDGAGWRLLPASVRLANEAPGQVRPDGTPWRFELPEGSGVSDHWPLVITIASPPGQSRGEHAMLPSAAARHGN